MAQIGVDSSFFVFAGATNKKGHKNGQLKIWVPSLESDVLNDYLGKLEVKKVIR